MRSFSLPDARYREFGPELPATIKPRGICLLAIEFLTRYPAAECVVTCAEPEYWNCVFDLFPKTVFQAFNSKLEDPPRPNVIRHWAAFDWQAAARFGNRGTPYSLIFSGEEMQEQEEAYALARPAAALLWITAWADRYLDGELFHPLYCSNDSCLSSLVPSPGQRRTRDYSPYMSVARWFQVHGRPAGSTYDEDMEDRILLAAARVISGICDERNVGLQVEVARSSLPPKNGHETVFRMPALIPQPVQCQHSVSQPVQRQPDSLPEYPGDPIEVNVQAEGQVEEIQDDNVHGSNISCENIEDLLKTVQEITKISKL